MIDNAAAVRAYVFYPLAAILAGAMIVASFGSSLRPIVPAAQSAVHDKNGYWFGPAQLAYIDAGAKQKLYVTRTWNGAVDSVQLATLRTAGAPTPAAGGARLLLTPETARVFQGHRLKMVVSYRQLYQNSATQLSVSLEGAPRGAWATLPIADAEGILRYTLEAPVGATLSSIGLWPNPQADKYYDYYGIQLLGLRIQPEG